MEEPVTASVAVQHPNAEEKLSVQGNELIEAHGVVAFATGPVDE
jgi:hypothetical protein